MGVKKGKIEDVLNSIKDFVPDWALPFLAALIPQHETSAEAAQSYAPNFYNQEISPQGQAMLGRVPFRQNFLPMLAQIPNRLIMGENLLSPAGGVALGETNFPGTSFRLIPPSIHIDPRNLQEGEFGSFDEFLKAYSSGRSLSTREKEIVKDLYEANYADPGRSELIRHEIGHTFEPSQSLLSRAYQTLEGETREAFAKAYGEPSFNLNPSSESYAMSVEAGLGQAPESIRTAAMSTPFFTPAAFRPGPAVPVSSKRTRPSGTSLFLPGASVPLPKSKRKSTRR